MATLLSALQGFACWYKTRRVFARPSNVRTLYDVQTPSLHFRLHSARSHWGSLCRHKYDAQLDICRCRCCCSLQATDVPTKSTGRAKKGLERLVAALKSAMPAPSFITSLCKVIRLDSGAADSVRRAALRMLSGACQLDPQKITDLSEDSSAFRAALTAALPLLTEASCIAFKAPEHQGRQSKSIMPPFDAGVTAATRQMALEALDAVVSAVGGDAARDRDINSALVATVPNLVQAAKDGNGGVRGSALASLGRVAKTAPSSMVPNIPLAMPVVLDTLDAAAVAALEKEGDALELTAALSALSVFVSVLPRLLSPYLPRIMELLLGLAETSVSDPIAKRAIHAILSELPIHLEARLLVPALANHMPRALQNGTAALVTLLSLVQNMVRALPSAAVQSHADDLASLTMSALNVRSSQPPGIVVSTAESAAVDTLVALVLKLSEVRFKPLFLRISEWGSSVPAHAAALSDPADQFAALVARQTTFLRCVSALSSALLVLFTPYYAHVMDLMVLSLGAESGEGGAVAGELRPAKRRKKKERGASGKASTDAAAAGEPRATKQRSKVEGSSLTGRHPESPAAAVAARQRIAVACVHKACLYDAEGAFVNGQRFEMLLEGLLKALQNAVDHEDAMDVLGESERALLARLEVGSRTKLPEGQTAVAAALVQLAMAATGDALWKMLNQKVPISPLFYHAIVKNYRLILMQRMEGFVTC
jgi:U3 small nucleolar RNA-associated protein 10